MAKVKFRFNSSSLQYDRIERTVGDRLLRFLAYLTGSLLLGFIYMLVFSYFFDLPKEKQLKRENNQMKAQYEIMNSKLDQVSIVLSDLEQRDDNMYRTIFEAEPISSYVRTQGRGGVSRYSELEGYDNSEIVIETAKTLDALTKRIVVQSKSYDELIDLARNKEVMVASIPAIMPISNKDLKRTASGWGWRIHPIYKIRKFHYGMDFTAPTGTPVYTTGDGVVDRIITSRRGYGNQVIIDHGFGYKTRYAHLDVKGFNVKKGQKVKRGDVIAFVGSTGLSTAPHLHYEVHRNGKMVDPKDFYFNDLTAAEYDRMIEISMKSGQSFD